jgi:hypothetical protein
VLRTLPALRRDGRLVAVPHLGYGCPMVQDDVRLVFDPPAPVAGATFFGAPGVQTHVVHPM